MSKHLKDPAQLREIHILRKQNLKLRLDLEVLADFPDSKAARKIRFQTKIRQRIHREACKAMEN